MNPYENIPSNAFWSPAVAKRHMLNIEGLWQAPFPIMQKTKIATYGSCFAQHFSKALVKRGYSWLNSEPGPVGVSSKITQRYNYGVFSSRTGNIYTTSLLKQWVEWAVKKSAPPEIYWKKNDRIYDPFRPAIEPEGFGSIDEMIKSRQTCIEAFRRSITQCGVLVFTLGLTESWWDSDGYEYPMCPGTYAGEFDKSRHYFLNQDYSFVRENLLNAISLIRKERKKGPRILLTVSPVPLTATNSGNHVLVATMESKSILRAVAGNVAAGIKGTSYFPSYEIINSPVFRGVFFEPNLRSVNSYGVDHVMNCFFAGLSDSSNVKISDELKLNQQDKVNSSVAMPDDIKCEEELLQVFGIDK